MFENLHQRVRAPERCPNCQFFHQLKALGYYWRWTTDAIGKAIRFPVRRFLCWQCGHTVSCLPEFAQPYRLVANPTIEAYISGHADRRDVQSNKELLWRYLKRFVPWHPNLLQIIGNRFGRAGPHETATAFWLKAVALCGSLAELSFRLVEEFRTTCFRTYRCHQPSCAK